MILQFHLTLQNIRHRHATSVDENATHVTRALLEMLLVPCAKKEDITKLCVVVEEINPYMSFMMTLTP